MRSKVTLILCIDKKNYFFPYIEEEGIVLEEVYKAAKNKLQYYWIKLFKKLPYLSRLCYGTWRDHIAEFDKIVILDEAYDPPIQDFLKRYEVPAYLYAWNSVLNHKTKLYKSIKRTKQIPVYSFDKQDCIKYNLKYNTTMYPRKLADPYIFRRKCDKQYALFFVGYDKGRGKKIEDLKRYLDHCGLKHYFKIIDSGKRMEYAEYLTILNDSGAILEVVQEGQSGISMRTMESLFYEKKLVTTNRSVKEYEFYNPKNMFILGEDSLEKLPQFLESEYEQVPKEIVGQYDLKQWVSRFV